MTGEARPVDGADLAEGMTVEYGGRAYTIKGIADGLEGGRRRNAYVQDPAGRPAAFPVYRGTVYPVVDSAPGGAASRGGAVTAAPDPYSRCPDCGFIAPRESMDYALTPDRGIDWDEPVRVTCLCCRARYAIGARDVVAADTETACTRCAATIAHPGGAARIRCTGCGLYLTGPGLDETRREELRITEGLADLALREAYLAARRRAGKAAGQ